jgi:hypothetical protein
VGAVCGLENKEGGEEESPRGAMSRSETSQPQEQQLQQAPANNTTAPTTINTFSIPFLFIFFIVLILILFHNVFIIISP